jgi:hypothetical protein
MFTFSEFSPITERKQVHKRSILWLQLFKLSVMKKFVLLFLFINLQIVAYNQVIKGTVFDQKTKERIGFATLYFNGTFVGTYSDENGNFELDVSKNASMALTISAIGYYSFTLTEFSTGKPVLVYLTPKVYEMKEVVVSAKSHAMQRKANLRTFRNQFLGETDNARNCTIMNESDITFNYDSDRDTLKAFASKPIIIDNRALGYKITYFLDKFEYYRRSNSFIFKGNIIFTKNLITEESEKQAFERKRKTAYLGSRMHFFRALWADDLKSTGFVIENSAGEILAYKDIVDDKVSPRKFLQYPDKLGICYYTKLPVSTIVFLKQQVYFDSNGYFDPTGISWEGEMVKQRIADWLPYEYSPGSSLLIARYSSQLPFLQPYKYVMIAANVLLHDR